MKCLFYCYLTSDPHEILLTIYGAARRRHSNGKGQLIFVYTYVHVANNAQHLGYIYVWCIAYTCSVISVLSLYVWVLCVYKTHKHAVDLPDVIWCATIYRHQFYGGRSWKLLTILHVFFCYIRYWVQTHSKAFYWYFIINAPFDWQRAVHRVVYGRL